MTKTIALILFREIISACFENCTKHKMASVSKMQLRNVKAGDKKKLPVSFKIYEYRVQSNRINIALYNTSS
jgi:hypothetical protein